MQKMTLRPPSTEALTLRAMNYSRNQYIWSFPSCQELPMQRTYLVRLLQDNPALTVSNDGPVDLGIPELLNTNFTSESTVGLVEDILSSNTNLLIGDLAGKGQVESGRGDDNLSGGVELSRVEVVDDGGDTVSTTVPV